MFTCLYVVTCYLVAVTFVHANSVRKIIISIHVSLQLPKLAYCGENTPPPLPYIICVSFLYFIVSHSYIISTLLMCHALQHCG